MMLMFLSRTKTATEIMAAQDTLYAWRSGKVEGARSDSELFVYQKCMKSPQLKRREDDIGKYCVRTSAKKSFMMGGGGGGTTKKYPFINLICGIHSTLIYFFMRRW